MVFPYTTSAKLSQFPYRYYWHECWHLRFITYGVVFLLVPLYWKIDKKLTSPENKAYWREKRKADHEHHHAELVKKWEIRT